MSVIDSVLLGVVQGLTEFLPVSSSGHLILMRELLGINTSGGLAFDAILQLGTVVAALLYFRRDVWKLIVDAWHIVTGNRKRVAPQDQAYLLAIIVGTLPALVLGILLEKTMDTLFRSALLVAITLILGSILFMLAEQYGKQRRKDVTAKDGFWTGVFQSLALVPGISRSGATISGGLFRGLTRETAARFSFLLSLPIITASGLKKLLDVVKDTPTDIQGLQLAIGFIVSFAVGIACVHWLLGYLKKHGLSVFAWYRIALGVIVIAIVMLR
ncbi:MAG: undecaprenyl-diphosphatase UppP [Patescibacteria group bacterium]